MFKDDTESANFDEEPQRKKHVWSIYQQDVEIDYSEAVKQFYYATRDNRSDSQYHLGECYRLGGCVDKDDFRAMKWYRRAAMQNHTGAQFHLSQYYVDGVVVPRNYVEAYAWRELVTLTDPFSAQSRDYLAKKMSWREISKAKKRASELRLMIGI